MLGAIDLNFRLIDGDLFAKSGSLARRRILADETTIYPFHMVVESGSIRQRKTPARYSNTLSARCSISLSSHDKILSFSEPSILCS
jgi:hypothetical protein